MTDFSQGNPGISSTLQICSPGNVRVQRPSPASVILTWDEPYATCPLCPDAVGYEVSGAGIVTVSVTRPPCEVTGLQANGKYWLSVIAKAAGNNVSKPTLIEVADKVAPSVPEDFKAIDVTRHSVMLSWTASTDEVAVMGYAVRRDGDWFQNVLTGTSVNATHLTPGKTYVFSVAAYDFSNNYSAYSQCRVTTTPDTMAPTMPSRLKFLHNTNITKGTLYWDQSNDDELMESYEIAIDQKVIHTVPHDHGGGSGRQVLSGLEEGVTYLMTIRAMDIYQNYSEAAQLLVTPGHDTTIPTSPANVKATLLTDGAVLVWDPSDDNAILIYRVEFEGKNLPVSLPVIMLPMLLPDTTYSVKITAVDPGGNTSEPTDFVFKTLSAP